MAPQQAIPRLRRLFPFTQQRYSRGLRVEICEAAPKDRKPFLSLIGKLLPTQLTGTYGGPLELLVQKAQAGLQADR